MYKNNSGLIAKTKISKYKKGLCLRANQCFLFRYYSYTNRCNTLQKNEKTISFNNFIFHYN